MHNFLTVSGYEVLCQWRLIRESASHVKKPTVLLPLLFGGISPLCYGTKYMTFTYKLNTL